MSFGDLIGRYVDRSVHIGAVLYNTDWFGVQMSQYCQTWPQWLCRITVALVVMGYPVVRWNMALKRMLLISIIRIVGILIG